MMRRSVGTATVKLMETINNGIEDPKPIENDTKSYPTSCLLGRNVFKVSYHQRSTRSHTSEPTDKQDNHW